MKLAQNINYCSQQLLYMMNKRRRRIIKGLGIGLFSGLSGCSSTSSEPDNPTKTNSNQSTPQSTTSSQATSTPSRSKPKLAGYGFAEYGITGDVYVEEDNPEFLQMDLTNKSGRTYPAVHIEFRDKETWRTQYGPGEHTNVFLDVGEPLEPGGRSPIEKFTIYPQLWPETLPDTTPYDPREVPSDLINEQKQILHGEIVSDEIHIPLPDTIDASSVSHGFIQSIPTPTEKIRFEIGSDSDLAVDSDAGIRIPSEILPSAYHGGNPYRMELTGVSQELFRLVTLPVPEFSISNFTANGEVDSEQLVWEDLSYDLTIGDALVDEFTLKTAVDGVPGRFEETSVQPGTTNSISLTASTDRSLGLPVETEQISILSMTPYPVAEATTDISISE
jgi:hypothetical protein